jgi:hypothetical protein
MAKCSGCGQEFPKTPDGNDYIAMPLKVESWMVTRHKPGSYNFCGDCLLESIIKESPKGWRKLFC